MEVRTARSKRKFEDSDFKNMINKIEELDKLSPSKEFSSER